MGFSFQRLVSVGFFALPLLGTGLFACQTLAPGATLSGAQPRGVRAATLVWREIPAPADNPVTQAKVELGFRLWFEPRLSGNGRMTCGTCHQHNRGFSNGQRNAEGIHGRRGRRSVPTIYAAAGSSQQFWDGRAESLEAQALGPVTDPLEMDAKLDDVVRRLNSHPYYPKKFKEAFGETVTPEGIARALASFERALQTELSPYERFLRGDSAALTEQQQLGNRLFNSSRGRCFSCHSGPDLTDRLFHNTGVGARDASPDSGRFLVTGNPGDKGRFKTPTLRNVALTAPYMHNGTLPTLEAVVAFYDQGGFPNSNLDRNLVPLGLTGEERDALVAFLSALSAPDNLITIARLPGVRDPKRPDEPLSLPQDLLR
ncbi:MAG: cytochrome c peroxidase [Candidatus Sericytochromatia bacterium]|nr:cytochrome c peroxidase [Candidatus Sericytochromatia bacterium]